ncbi:MAG: LysM peptidoglycan-binding domain-containing protein [Candidatus Kapabacteria bacterium]|nr:LysM peptidoglycan-binding domain-containing protein [Candidatus Kapabacteria bacterium]
MVHVVRRGETLAQIADDYNTTIQAIAQGNNLKLKRGLMAGQKLKVVTTADATQEAPAVAETKPARNTEQDDERPAGTLKKHKVARGQTIGTIAALYSVRESQIVKWNPSLRDGVVNAGERLNIYVTATAAKGSADATPRTVNKLPKTYTVRNGDTMYSIARKYGVSVAQLEAKNKAAGGTLRIGQKIRLQ